MNERDRPNGRGQGRVGEREGRGRSSLGFGMDHEPATPDSSAQSKPQPRLLSRSAVLLALLLSPPSIFLVDLLILETSLFDGQNNLISASDPRRIYSTGGGETAYDVLLDPWEKERAPETLAPHLLADAWNDTYVPQVIGTPSPWNSEGWPSTFDEFIRIRCIGFPFRATWAWIWTPMYGGGRPTEGGFLEIPMGRLGLWIPIRPLWFGLFADLLFYAVLWLMIFAGIGSLKRQLRFRKGCCATCNYNLTGNTRGKCPECGAMTGIEMG